MVGKEVNYRKNFRTLNACNDVINKGRLDEPGFTQQDLPVQKIYSTTKMLVA